MSVFHYFFGIIISNGSTITIIVAVIGWTLIIAAGVIRFVRTENQRILDLTLQALKSEIFLEVSTQINRLRESLND